jgi:hypothetical protein
MARPQVRATLVKALSFVGGADLSFRLFFVCLTRFCLNRAVYLSAALLVYPCSTVKIRLIADAGNRLPHYSGALDCLAKTWRGEGMGGLFKGATLLVVHQMTYVVLRVFVLEKVAAGRFPLWDWVYSRVRRLGSG